MDVSRTAVRSSSPPSSSSVPPRPRPRGGQLCGAPNQERLMSDGQGGTLTPRRWLEVATSAALRAAVDRIIPADDWPGGWDGGVRAYLAEGASEQPWALDGLERLVA